MSDEISKNTIIVLVVLTVVISLLGTWTVINEVNNIKLTSQTLNKGTQSGQVTLTIDPSPPPIEKIEATGQVVLSKIQ